MKSVSLHALIIDRHFGELSSEAVELLEHHLTGNASARAEAERILESLNVTRDAVLRHPELAYVSAIEKRPAPAPRRVSPIMPWLAHAAAMVLLAALAGAGGFVAGRSGSLAKTDAVETKPAQRKESPWAKYRMTFDPAGEGMQVVRVDSANLEKKAYP